MNPTEETVEKALDGLDNSLQKDAETKNVNDKEQETPLEKDNPNEDPEKDKNPQDEEGFTADQVDDDNSSDDDQPSNTETTDIDTNNLNDEAKYIVENLPYITARIKDGNNVKDVQIKSWTQLPEDVEFASKRDEIAFVNALTAQENKARELQLKFQQTQQNEQTRKFEELENEAIREDITELQKEGELPKFKVKADDPKFSKDPATEEVQKILDFMNDRNEQYLKEYQQGRAYRHIGFREAFSLYKRSQPNKEEISEDKERQNIARKNNANRGMSSRDLKKPTVKAGTTIDQILNRIDTEEW